MSDSSLAPYWEKYAIWLSGVVIAICAWMWVEYYGRLNELEAKVVALQQDKVSRQELKDLDERMDKRMENMKKDIIDRLDWYFAGRKSKDTN